VSQYPNELLAQADKLLRPAKGKPTQADLRRAVSSAYYALFHFLIEEATLSIVGTARAKEPLRQLVGRGFNHTAMREASAEVFKGTPRDLLKPFWPRYSVSTNATLQSLARLFVILQQQRHRADYDLSQPFALKEADALLQEARRAINNWETLKKNDSEIAQFYALSLFCWNNWKTR